jgi:hemoglobin
MVMSPQGKGKAMSGLFEKLGGEAAVNAAVDIFYRKVLSDDSINGFFETTDMEAQHAKQKAFLTMAFGGPNSYTGKDMRTAHAPLVAKGLNEAHFNAVAGHLQATLEELNVPANLVDEVMSIAGSTKSDILGL